MRAMPEGLKDAGHAAADMDREEVARWREEHRDAQRAADAATRAVQEAEERLVRERKPAAQSELDEASKRQREALAGLSSVREKALRAGIPYRALDP